MSDPIPPDPPGATQDSPREDSLAETEFEKLAGERPLSLAEEFLLFIVENKKWWLTPILLVLALLGLFVVLTTTGAAPFIYAGF